MNTILALAARSLKHFYWVWLAVLAGLAGVALLNFLAQV